MSDFTSLAIEALAAREIERARLFDQLDRIEDSQRQLIALFGKKPDAPADTPTVPALPAKTAAMFLYENWQNSALYYVQDTSPLIKWTRANSVEGNQGQPNSERVSSDIIDYGGGKVLRLRLAPTTYPQSVGARVVLTDQKRWTALQPYAGKKLYGRLWLMFPTLPAIDEAGGTAGRWLSAGFQIKDDPNISALYQWNVNQQLFPFLKYRLGAVAEARTLRPPYKAGKWTQLDFEWLMTSANDGYFNVSIDGVAAYAVGGRSAAANGFATFHLLLYGDSLRAPADLLVRGVIISTEPLP